MVNSKNLVKIAKIIYKKIRTIKEKYILLFNIIQFKINNVEIRRCDVKYIKGKMKIRNLGDIVIGGNVTINSGAIYNLTGGQEYTSFLVFEGGRLEIHDNVGISNTSICSKNKIIIRSNVLVGCNCKIWDTDFHSINFKDRLIDSANIKAEPIEIKSGAWIGGYSIILKGVTIGENSIVAAGSVVTKSIPDNEVWGGNPAKFIKDLI